MGKDDIRLVGGSEVPTLPGQPTILAAIGRQRVGKTSFENALAQVVKEKGGHVEVVNADTLNRSHSISTFHPGATTAPNASIAEQALWMERTLTRVMGEGRDAIIDVGGGHTALHQVIEETPLAELMEWYCWGREDTVDEQVLAELRRLGWDLVLPELKDRDLPLAERALTQENVVVLEVHECSALW